MKKVLLIVGLVVGTLCAQTTTFSGTPTPAEGVSGNTLFTGATSTCRLNGVSVVGGSCAATWGGGDIGAQINAAYAAGPPNGVAIRVMPGIYDYTTPITINSSSKPLDMECPNGVANNNASAPSTTQLHYTSTSGLPAFTFAGVGSSLSGCSLSGAGPTYPTVGLLVGGPTSGAAFISGTIKHVDIGGFGTGLELGYNVYISRFLDNSIHDNQTNLYSPSSTSGTGENVAFEGGQFNNHGTSFSTTCVNIQTGGDYHFRDLSIDQCGVTIDGINIFIDYDSVHVENPNGPTASPFFTFGTSCNICTLNVYGGEWYEDGTIGVRTEFIKDTSAIANHGVSVNIYGGTFVPSEKVAQLVNFAGAGCCAQGFANNFQNGIGGGVFTSTFGGKSSNGLVDFRTTNVFGLRWGANASTLGQLINHNSANRNYNFADKDCASPCSMAEVLTATSAAFATATTAGTCVSHVTAVTGAATTMVAIASPVSTPGVGAQWSAFVSGAGNVTIIECAVAASAGGTIAFNIRVIQ